jgi:hypothetical protein
MSDYYMDDEKWNKNELRIESWVAANPDNMVGQTALAIMSQGKDNANIRKRLWAAIGGIFVAIDNSPIQRGKPRQSLPAHVEALLGVAVSLVKNLRMDIYTDNPSIIGLERRARTTKKTSVYFDNAEEYAEYHSSLFERHMVDAYIAHDTKDAEARVTWNGKDVDSDNMPNCVTIAALEADEEE